jgi:hypothetical protein
VYDEFLGGINDMSDDLKKAEELQAEIQKLKA